MPKRQRSQTMPRHPEVAAQRPSKDARPGHINNASRRPSRLASRAPQGDGDSTPPLDEAEALRARQERIFRHVAEAFRVHRFCTKKPCRRARKCTGDAQACFGEFFRGLPDDERAWLRWGIEARCNGHDPKAAAKIANDKLAQHARVAARFEEARIPPLQGRAIAFGRA